VAVDIPLAHLDRPFDYLVPEGADELAVPGSRVRVRFAGRLVDGFVLARLDGSEHAGDLSFLVRSVSAEPVLSPELETLARAVADRYAGTLADVLRLAIPPRHAAVEAEPAGRSAHEPVERPPAGGWSDYAGGAQFLAAIAEGGRPRAVWTALPGPGWPAELATAAAATLASGRSALLIVPDARDVTRVGQALRQRLGPGRHVELSADLGPAERYRRWLAVRRGAVRAVVGTRSASFAPVTRLGLVVCWDDGDDLHAEPRAPYPHVREVLALRAHLESAGLLVGGFVCTAEGAALCRSRWANRLAPSRAAVRERAPRVNASGEDHELARDAAAQAARLPSVAWSAARDGLRTGPVLIQVPRRGYIPTLACAACRASARCHRCAGPLGLPGPGPGSPPACRWCGRPAADWHCPECGSTRARAVVVGARRTAEELGRAFPGVPVRTSGRDEVLATVSTDPVLVVATPGAEPVPSGGYAAALLLDGWALLTRPDLRAAEEALRRWAAAAALVRPAGEGGRVVVVADGGIRPVQALIRWDPIGFADDELEERTQLRFPPAVRLAAISGAPAAVADLLAASDLPDSVERLGPVPVGNGSAERLLLRVPRRDGARLAAGLKAAAAVRSARKAIEPVRVQLDPRELG